MALAPIVLFVYNRLEYFLQTVQALQNNHLAEKSELFVFCDGPKSDKDMEKIRKVRKNAYNIFGFKSITIIERESNLGLSNSVISGVTEIVSKYGKAIVLEDDIVTSPYFLKFMNDALVKYAYDERILSIGACNYFANSKKNSNTFFVIMPDCWGWAVWERSWSNFNSDGSELYQILKGKNMLNNYNLDGTYDFEQMLIGQIAGKIDSWNIRWYAYATIHGKLTLYPKYSLSRHIGYDASSTHGGMDLSKYMKFPKKEIKIQDIIIEENVIAKKEMINSMKKIYNKKSLLSRFKISIKKVLK